jgi:CubicO group peptidase (beta-lactamase class C family)
MPHKRLLLLTLIIWFTPHIFAQELKEIDQLFERFNTATSPGASVVIVREGRVIHAKSYGMANLEYEIPITARTRFHIGSVSKQFTAFAVLLLAEQERLSTDDPIKKYLTDLPDCMNGIRIRHLIHHTSGVREIETLQQMAGISSADQQSGDYIYELIKNQKGLNFQPGEEVSYANTGYFLLARIIEKVTGESFPAWMQKTIFTPLGMSDTIVVDDCTAIIKNRAYPYWDNDGKMIKGILSYSYAGPTGVNTTCTDIAKWLANFSNPRIGSPKTITRLLTETDTLNSGAPNDYGFGLGITTRHGLRVVLHSGHDAAYRAAMLYFPDQQTGIAVLGNFYSLNAMEYGGKIADIILSDKIGSRPPTADENPRHVGVKTAPYDIKPEQLSAFAGRYCSDELGIQYRLAVRENKLMAEHWRNDPVTLTPEGPDRFTGDAYWMQSVIFVRDNSGRIAGFQLSSERARHIFFDRIPDK